MDMRGRSKLVLFIILWLSLLTDVCYAQPANVQITRNNRWQNEPMVAINPLHHNKLVAAFNDSRTGQFRVGWAWSDKGGTEWTNGGTIIPGGAGNPGGYDRGVDPVVAFDRHGTAYMTWMGYNLPPPNHAEDDLGRDGSIFIARSGDGGRTFDVFQKRIAQGEGAATYYDKPWLYINPINDHIYVAWVKRTNAWNVGGNQSMVIELVRSTDGAGSFSNPVQVSDFYPATGTSASHGPQIAAGPGENVFVAWHTLEHGRPGAPDWQPPRIWIAQSDNDGQSFGGSQLVAIQQNNLPNRFISLAVDRSSGRLYMAYVDKPPNSGDTDVYVTTAPALGGPWVPTRINDDGVGNGRHQFYPSLDVAPNGRVDVVWYDNRDNSSRYNVYYSFTVNGGNNWEANRKLTDNNGFNWPTEFYGDYMTIASEDDKAYAVWMDNRLGNQEIYGASMVHMPGIMLLFDTSGSMLWGPDGTISVPTDEKRLTLAKRAAIPFMEMIEDHCLGQVYIGIVNFPRHPWSGTAGCMGDLVMPIVLADANNINDAIGPAGIIQTLQAEGKTPLLGGVTAALEALGSLPQQAILLLSDGYHNCPSTVSADDAVVTDLIGQIQSQYARVYAIGFGRPTDIDHPLLHTLSTSSGGSFFNVTIPGFVAGDWDPQTALQATYKSIFIDWLGLDRIDDPFGTIQTGQQQRYEVPITSYSQKVSFFLSWATATAGRLGFRILASDGLPVVEDEGTMDVKVHEGETHVLITVDESFLARPGKVGSAPWTLEIDAENINTDQIRFQYSVFSASSLKMLPELRTQAFVTGTNLIITAAITEGGQPIIGLGDVKVRVGRPSDGLGNWYAENQVTDAELKTVPTQIGAETLSPQVRKAHYLIDQRKVDLPSRLDEEFLTLFDDGTHGDGNKDDGVYGNRFSDTLKEGSYFFHFIATGTSSSGSTFRRETELQHYLLPVFSPGHSQVNFIDLDAETGLQRVRVIITPRDSLENYLGPGHAGAIQLSINHGRMIGVTTDNLDGTYSQVVEVPTSVTSDAQLNITLGDKTKTVAWPAGHEPEHWWIWLLIIFLLLIIAYLLSARRP
jgi:hypothetical protein